MVLLTMTPSIVEGLERLQSKAMATTTTETNEAQTTPKTTSVAEAVDESSIPDTPASSEPALSEPAVGAPISHSQIIELWTSLKAQLQDEAHTQSDGSRDPPMQTAAAPSLESLLVGARVYVPPPPPKKEPSPEYKALMARLRRDEEARAYERMVNPDPYTNMATARLTSAYAQVNRPVSAADMGDDDVTFSDVNRQVMLIFNFLLTMLGVAYALWVLARWWPTPSRLFLAMGGSIAVGIAEYGLYAGYVWHLAEAAKKDKAAAPNEVREVVKTWVVEREQKGEKEEKEEEEKTRADTDADAGKAASSEGAAVAIPDSTGASGIDSTQARRRRKEVS